jgi:hypothetical protein
MTLTYRTTGPWGAGKGSNLTAAEVDGNVYDHELRIADLEANPPEPNNIDSITLSGSQMTVIMEDASEFGPFTIPAARWAWRGDFEDATDYAINDIFTDPDTGSLYVVLIGHTSATPFDPDLLSGGNPVYELVIDGSVAGGGGGLGTVSLLSSTSSGSESLTPTLAQANYLFLTNDSVADGMTTMTIPPNSSVAFPVGTELRIMEYYYQAQIQAGSGVTIAGRTTSSFKTRETLSIIGVKKISTNGWVFFGDEYVDRINGNMTASPFNLEAYRRGTLYLWNSGSGKTVELSAEGGTLYTAFRTGDKFEFIQQGAGAITINPATGITINTISGGSYVSNGQGSHMTLLYLGSDTWQLYGDVA